MSLILHDNVIEGITPTADAEVTGFEGVNVNNWLLYNSWKPGVTGAPDLVFDLGSAKSVDTICVYGHNLFTEGCDLRLRYSVDDIAYFDAVSQFTVPDDGVIFKQFSTQSKRYWELRIANCTVDALISVVAFGTATVLPSDMYDGFRPPLRGKVKNINSVSVNGAFLGRSIQPIPLDIVITQKNASQAFVRGDWDTFLAHAQSLPFFFSWDENNYPDETVYAWSDPKETQPVYSDFNLLKVELKAKALRD